MDSRLFGDLLNSNLQHILNCKCTQNIEEKQLLLEGKVSIYDATAVRYTLHTSNIESTY